LKRESLTKKEGSIGTINRAKILAAAEKEFAIHGFTGTRVQRIADQAGLPKTNVLYYFKIQGQPVSGLAARNIEPVE
jgi:TetR/AcrR family transcriptional regulator